MQFHYTSQGVGPLAVMIGGNFIFDDTSVSPPLVVDCTQVVLAIQAANPVLTGPQQVALLQAFLYTYGQAHFAGVARQAAQVAAIPSIAGLIGTTAVIGA